MMFGFMFMDMESFNELKQSLGYGVVLHKDFKEVSLLGFSDVVMEVLVLRGNVSEKRIVKRRMKSL